MKNLKVLFLTVFLLVVTICSAQYEQSTTQYPNDGVKFLTKANFDTHVGNPRVIVVIEFWAGWNRANQCTFLKKLSGCKVYRIDTEASPALSGRFGISVVPTIVIFDGEKAAEKFEGNLSFQLPENVDKKHVQKAVDRIIGEKFQ